MSGGLPLPDLVARLQAALAGRYTIERELGYGGMAKVYLAHDLKHGRLVALKVLRPEIAAAVGAERFLREIKLAAALEHPHILPLHDSGDVHGFPYYVMPYVVGESLRKLLEREGQLPLTDALRITREVAEALDYAHRHGVVHRDIKPENILLADGQAVVADFGIARAVATAGAAKLTETGLVLGTPAYMSPEQGTGETHIDGRSDVYSLGCVLYEMLTGEPPYTGPTARAIMAKRLSEPIPHLRTVREVPELVERAVTRALAKAPADRWASGAEFAAALSATAPRRFSRGAAVLVLAALIGAGAAGVFWRSHRSDASGSALGSVAVLYLDNLSRDSGDAYLADGLTEEITARLGDVPRLQVKSRNAIRRGESSAPGDVTALGRALRVNYLVEGSLRRAGARVRVSVRLIRAKDGFRVWGEEYDRATADLLELERDVASAVATAIAGQLLPGERASLAARPTTNLAAYDHLLRGNYYAARRTPRATERAITEYGAAISMDSDYVDALFRLADAYALIVDYGWDYRGLAPESVLVLGLAAADRALRKDSTSADAWLARSDFLEALHPRTLEGVIEAEQRAIRSDPRSPKAYFAYGWDLAFVGDDSGAVQAWHRALAVDPDQPVSLVALAQVAFYQRRIQDALRWSDSSLAIDPGFHNGFVARAGFRLYAGDTAGARADAETALRLHAGDTLFEGSVLAMIDAREDDTGTARARVTRLLRRPDLYRPTAIQATFPASALVALGENSSALDLLERAPRSAQFGFWLRSPYLDPLRSDSRFKRLVDETRPPRAASR